MNYFADVERAEPDANYGVLEEYLRDPNPNKISLSIGVYRDENGKPYIPPSVKEAEKNVIKQNHHKEYAPIEGFSFFRNAAAEFSFGKNSDVIKNSRHATVQTLGGTGALRIGALFLHNFLPSENGNEHSVYLPEQTWSAHHPIFEYSGFRVKTYRYWHKERMGLDYDGLIEDITDMPQGSVIVLHEVAHNPTGVDPTPDQWRHLEAIINKSKVFPFFDMSYHGFASGDFDTDTFAMRLFANNGHQMALAQTFSKNMGLYGERIGSLSIVTQTADDAINVMTQLKRIIRPIYSHPSNNGAHIATELLSNEELKKKWLYDVKAMVSRIKKMRMTLKNALINLGSDKKWNQITDQIGMYWYSCLTIGQVMRLRKEFSIYIADDGRVNIAALNDANVSIVAKAIHCVTME